jgi:hypothetical protein
MARRNARFGRYEPTKNPKNVSQIGRSLTAAPTEVYAGKGHCLKKAKAKYADDRKARRAYRKACHAHHKAWKKAHKK